MNKKLTDILGKDHLDVQGSLNPLENAPADLREGIFNYWKGKGISLEVLNKYFGFSGSLSVEPDPRYQGSFF